MLCPQCDSLFVERQPSRGLLDTLAEFFSVYSFQCQSCKYRFRSFVSLGEHRRGIRVPIQIPVSFEWGEGRGEGVLTDISEGGCALESKRRLAPGLILRLRILAGTDETTGPAAQQVASVRWVQGDRAGMKFLALTPQEKHQLTQTITRCLRSAR